MPDRLTGDQARKRWLLETARNWALMRVLGETGGRVSEVLSLDVGDFPSRAFEAGEVWRVAVVGKGRHEYDLRFLKALAYIKVYQAARQQMYGADDIYPALFVKHTPAALKSKTNWLDRNSAWRIVSRAADGLGLGKVRVHDFRHWCATELIALGEPLEIVKEYLGHRSIQTTEKYYAHIRPERVDRATEGLLG